jgi:hypothetical protein
MYSCSTCLELSTRVEEALSNVNAKLKGIEKAVGEKDQKLVAALDLELESAVAHKSAAFRDWRLHRKTHEGACS